MEEVFDDIPYKEEYYKIRVIGKNASEVTKKEIDKSKVHFTRCHFLTKVKMGEYKASVV